MQRFARVFCLAALTLGTFSLAAPLLDPLAWATPTGPQILAALDDPAGWEPIGTSRGVNVFKKTLSGVNVPALRGERVATVNADAIYAKIANIAGQKFVNPMLAESVVLRKEGSSIDFYQVLKSPVPGSSPRYWINGAKNIKNVNGEAGHHKQTWELLPETSYPEVREQIKATYGDPVWTPLNYGSWEVRDQGEGKTLITYTVVSHPGGNVPEGAFSWGSEKSLPDNINGFVKAAGGS